MQLSLRKVQFRRLPCYGGVQGPVLLPERLTKPSRVAPSAPACPQKRARDSPERHPFTVLLPWERLSVLHLRRGGEISDPLSCKLPLATMGCRHRATAVGQPYANYYSRLDLKKQLHFTKENEKQQKVMEIETLIKIYQNRNIKQPKNAWKLYTQNTVYFILSAGRI